LAVYGLVAGLLLKVFRGKAATFCSLVGAMIAGRLVMGLLNSLIFRVGEYGWTVWLTASFVTALPGIIIQLVILPIVIFALKKAKLIA
jgi:niacin transporter